MAAVDVEPLSTLVYVFEIAGAMVGVLFVVSMLLAAVRWRPRRHGTYRATRQQLRPAQGPKPGGSAESSDGRRS